MKYKISREANLDLENIWLYTFENWSKDQADRYINLILDEIEYLADNPNTGQKYDRIRKGYFRSRIKSHLIFYKNYPKTTKLKLLEFYTRKWILILD